MIQNISSVAYDELQTEGLAVSEAFVPELNVIHGKLFEMKRSEVEFIQITGQLQISF